MQSKVLSGNKSKLSLISAALFIVFALLLTLGVQVTSQDKKDMKAQNASNNLQNDSNQRDAEIQEFINVLESDDEKLSSSTKINAIKRLGNAKVKRATALLIKYLDYEDKAEVLRTKPKTINGVTVITEQNDLSLSERYPATGALFQIGESALPALVKVIENEEPNSLKSQNALYAVQQIFVEDWLKAVLYLEKAAAESKNPDGSERLQRAARETKKMWDALQKQSPN